MHFDILPYTFVLGPLVHHVLYASLTTDVKAVMFTL